MRAKRQEAVRLDTVADAIEVLKTFPQDAEFRVAIHLNERATVHCRPDGFASHRDGFVVVYIPSPPQRIIDMAIRASNSCGDDDCVHSIGVPSRPGAN